MLVTIMAIFARIISITTRMDYQRLVSSPLRFDKDCRLSILDGSDTSCLGGHSIRCLGPARFLELKIYTS